MRMIPEWQKIIYQLSTQNGFWDETSNVDQKTLLIIREITEAQDEIRNGHKPNEIYYNRESDHPDKPEGYPVELADAAIRLFDLAAHQGIDLEAAMVLKHEYNKTRPYKHGKAF